MLVYIYTGSYGMESDPIYQALLVCVGSRKEFLGDFVTFIHPRHPTLGHALGRVIWFDEQVYTAI